MASAADVLAIHALVIQSTEELVSDPFPVHQVKSAESANQCAQR